VGSPTNSSIEEESRESETRHEVGDEQAEKAAAGSRSAEEDDHVEEGRTNAGMLQALILD
jgi:hypothetical protein